MTKSPVAETSAPSADSPRLPIRSERWPLIGATTNTVSGIAGTTAAADCRVLTSGNIAVVWSGTTDTVRIYNSALSTTIASYSNLALLSTPGGIAQRTNGNLLVVDRVLNQIIEITEGGVFVNGLPRSVLSTPEFIEVVP